MIKKEEIEHLAKLARIGLTKKEKEKFQKDLSLILDYFKLLEEIDTENVLATSHPISIKAPFRKDEFLKPDPKNIQKLIEMAPQKEKGYLKVKSIL
jgi:aspartyl/glutamyl-tRNA(Asn/Gln) amidotransferase C subunit